MFSALPWYHFNLICLVRYSGTISTWYV